MEDPPRCSAAGPDALLPEPVAVFQPEIAAAHSKTESGSDESMGGARARRPSNWAPLVPLCLMLAWIAGFPLAVPTTDPVRDLYAAWQTTPPRIREANVFSFSPMVEVATLFAGIFVTMAPALAVLNERAGALGIREPWHFFWAAGALSSVLDNAPTYLTFAAAASGLAELPMHGRYLADYLAIGPHAARTLAAISCGAVFMGANTYIGNGPNFMVKAIAEENGVRMPSFLGYMAYSGAILIPLFVVTTLLFFR